MSSSVGRNSLIMASGTAASRVTGQIRTILLAWALGTTGYAANAYQAGSMIPQVIYTLVSGGIFNAVLVPQIVRTLKAKDAETRLNKLITLAITIWVARTLSKNGEVFLIQCFGHDAQLARSTNHLLVVGFYLVNIGFISGRITFTSFVTSSAPSSSAASSSATGIWLKPFRISRQL